jgi:alpha-aminoadipate carrier protein LysW
MPICPECESVLDFDADDVDEGDTVECDECGTEFEVVSVDPLEITKVDEALEDDDEYKEEEEEEE